MLAGVGFPLLEEGAQLVLQELPADGEYEYVAVFLRSFGVLVDLGDGLEVPFRIVLGLQLLSNHADLLLLLHVVVLVARTAPTLEHIVALALVLVHLAGVVEEELLEEPVVEGHVLGLGALVHPGEGHVHEVVRHVLGELDVELALVPVQVDEESPGDLEVRAVLQQAPVLDLLVEVNVEYLVLVLVLPEHLLLLVVAIHAQQDRVDQICQDLHAGREV